jgi:hypothetical protein
MPIPSLHNSFHRPHTGYGIEYEVYVYGETSYLMQNFEVCDREIKP